MLNSRDGLPERHKIGWGWKSNHGTLASIL